MAIMCLTSCNGAPGGTTLAVGLALSWPRPVLLVDADPGAHQSVLAGYLTGRSAGGKGLLRVAEAHRDRRPLREVVVDQCLSLVAADGAGPEGGGTTGDRRLFLPGFTKPTSAAHFAGVWEELADTFERLGDVDVDVIVDLGRIGPLGLPAPLLERSALTAVVLRSDLRSVMSARVHLPTVVDPRVSTGPRGRTGLVLVDPGRPYPASEIGKALGLPVLAQVAHDPVAAAHFSDGATQHRRFEASPLLRSIRNAASTFADALQRSTALVRS
ncbi:hypothetical protein [uncultured Friedmanniella sp.]|uniref:hypothetical protein n=1 Tax=uncultured Friedmanniella sp. TaxID=335381 RepID=UPI0035C95661